MLAPTPVAPTRKVVVVTRTVALPKPAGPTHDCKALLAKGYPRDHVTQYWENLGRPADMDDDANGYPCETVYGRAFPAALLGARSDASVTSTCSSKSYLVCRLTVAPPR
jgi:hypothetical protein